MTRIIIALLIGAVLGVAGTVFVAGTMIGGTDSTAGGIVVTTGSGSTDSPANGRSREVSADRYIDAYRAAEQYADAGEIEARLAALFAEPFSIGRDARIAAMFERLAALDLVRALRIAETPGFDVRLVARVLSAFAELNPDAAIEALAAMRNPALQVDLAVALLGTLGNNAENVERIADSLPEHQRVNLQIEALGALAQSDPDGALRTAVALSDAGVRNAAAQRVGMEWMHQDPAAAFEIRSNLPNELREGYRDAVAVEWARLDSDGFLAYADTQPLLEDTLLGLMHTIGVAPGRTFEVGANHPALRIIGNFPNTYTVETVGFMNAAAVDPDAYQALVEGLPEGQRKQLLLRSLASTLGRIRPEEGTAWARSLNNPQLEAVVANQAIFYDYDVAYRLMEEFSERYNQPGLLRNIANNIGNSASGDPRRAEIATELLARRDDESASLVLNQLMRRWVATDAEGALEWMLASGSAVDPALAATIAGRLANREAARTAAYLDRIPPELRQTWLEQVAPAYASQDPEAAAIWMTQFQGEPGYDGIYQRVVQQMAQVDPNGAAQLLASAPANQQQGVALNLVVNGLAQDSLTAASQWALGLRDEAARSRAVSQVASDWANRDPRAAQRWAVRLPRGALRDQALSSIVNRLSRDGFHQTIETDLLDAFESERLRDQQVIRLVRSIAPDDPDYAHSLLDNWVSDPLLREQGVQTIETAR